MTPEGKVKDAINKLLVRNGCWRYMPVQNGLGRTGIPDIIGCIPTMITPDMVGKVIGQFIAVETKAPGKLSRVTPNQQRELQGIADAGGIAVLADDVSIVVEALNQPPPMLVGGEFGSQEHGKIYGASKNVQR